MNQSDADRERADLYSQFHIVQYFNFIIMDIAVK